MSDSSIRLLNIFWYVFHANSELFSAEFSRSIIYNRNRSCHLLFLISLFLYFLCVGPLYPFSITASYILYYWNFPFLLVLEVLIINFKHFSSEITCGRMGLPSQGEVTFYTVCLQISLNNSEN